MIEINIGKKLSSASGDMYLKVNLGIEKGSFLTLYGKSGAGKTSLLRIIAGLLAPDEGSLKVDGKSWFDALHKVNLSSRKRGIGFVFQDYALFPNMSVKQNLEYALPPQGNISVVKDLVDIMELGDLQDRKPETLSGGQKQRVAVARSLVQKPEILLLDEPLSALDAEIRAKLQNYILKAHREFQLTTILVSHDISEILKMSDGMAIIEHGEIIKQGTPSEVLTHKNVSGKFQFTGEVIALKKQDFIYILTILIGKDLVKVVADEDEVDKLVIGDKVLVASKAFNPIVKKIG